MCDTTMFQVFSSSRNRGFQDINPILLKAFSTLQPWIVESMSCYTITLTPSPSPWRWIAWMGGSPWKGADQASDNHWTRLGGSLLYSMYPCDASLGWPNDPYEEEIFPIRASNLLQSYDKRMQVRCVDVCGEVGERQLKWGDVLERSARMLW